MSSRLAAQAVPSCADRDTGAVDLRLTFDVSPIDFDGVDTPPAPAEVEGLTRADLTELSSGIDAAVRLSTEPGSVGKG